jgi:hypothetical protein
MKALEWLLARFVRSQKPRGSRRGVSANGLALTPYFSDYTKKRKLKRKIQERLNASESNF